MRCTFLALGGVVLILATACGSSHPGTAAGSTALTTPPPASASTPVTTGEPVDTTVVPTATTIPTTTTSPGTVPDTTVVPKQITVAYVNAVLAKLNHVYGNAVRASVTDRKVTLPIIEDLSAIYSAKLAAEEETLFVQAISEHLPNVRAIPGDPITLVQKLIRASPACIYARVQTNSDPILLSPVAPLADEYMGLQRVAPGGGLGRNHTPWVLFFDLVNKTATNVPDQCSDA